MTRPQSVETPLDLSNIQRFPMGFWHVQGQMWTRHWQTAVLDRCPTSSRWSLCAVQPGKFYLSGISTEVVCHFCQVLWFAGNVIMIMARFNSGIFWLCIRKKKHLEVFKFDFEKNEMPNVSSIESSVDARSTLWESTRWCLLKVIPAFWCLKV
jgi:hypothetical protein